MILSNFIGPSPKILSALIAVIFVLNMINLKTFHFLYPLPLLSFLVFPFITANFTSCILHKCRSRLWLCKLENIKIKLLSSLSASFQRNITTFKVLVKSHTLQSETIYWFFHLMGLELWYLVKIFSHLELRKMSIVKQICSPLGLQLHFNSKMNNYFHLHCSTTIEIGRKQMFHHGLLTHR